MSKQDVLSYSDASSLYEDPANEFGVDSWPAHPARRDDPCLACVAGSSAASGGLSF
jgi:hypothetical protein